MTDFNFNAPYAFAHHNNMVFCGGRVPGGMGFSPAARVLYSEDNGISWKESQDFTDSVTSGMNEIRRLHSCSFDNYLYAGMQSGTPEVWRSLNGIDGWEQAFVMNATDGYSRWFIEFDDGGGTELYMSARADSGTGARIFRTIGGDGTSWEQAHQFASTITLGASFFFDNTNSTLYCSTNNAQTGNAGGIFRTTNGSTWTKTNAAQFAGANILHSMVEWGGYAYVGTIGESDGGSIWRSQRDGVSGFFEDWTEVVSNGFGVGSDQDEVYRIYPWGDLLICGTRDLVNGGRIYYSTDKINGTAWTLLGTPGNGDSGAKGIFDFLEVNNRLLTGHRRLDTTTDEPSRPLWVGQS